MPVGAHSFATQQSITTFDVYLLEVPKTIALDFYTGLVSLRWTLPPPLADDPTAGTSSASQQPLFTRQELSSESGIYGEQTGRAFAKVIASVMWLFRPTQNLLSKKSKHYSVQDTHHVPTRASAPDRRRYYIGKAPKQDPKG
jgi:hypothetical protein